jgi:glycosyltransferase involved in cell wall biosynthesis
VRLCLDLQGAQTESRFRGIGRYSAGLARALIATAGQHDVELLFNAALASRENADPHGLSELVSRDRRMIFEVPGQVSEILAGNEWRARAAERIREAFVAGVAPDIIHVSSVIEGWIDDAVTSIGAFDDSVPTAATIYDAIPLVQQDGYFADPRFRRFYLRKAESLRRAGLLLAISEHAREEAISALGCDPERIVAIGCGVDACFTVEGDPVADGRLRARHGVCDHYIFYAGGFDARKNVAKLVEAYARLPRLLCDRFPLVIGGRIGDLERQQLQEAARNCSIDRSRVTFTGALDDASLAALYRGAELFVFPSRHEGFGLPAAEAMACGAPVIASRTSSLPEVVGRDDALFDPEQPEAIAAMMERVLANPDLRAALRRHGIERARRFSWSACAARAWPAFEALHERSRFRGATVAVGTARPRLAYVSPMPPQRSGIADYSAALLPELGRYYEIEVIAERSPWEPPGVVLGSNVRTYEWFEANAREFDRVLYHMGNSPFHVRMLDALSRHPGTVVTHDFFLSSMLDWLEEQDREGAAFRRALYLSHGYPALVEYQALGRVAARERFPASLEVYRRAAGIIAHSDYSLELARRWYGPAAVADAVVIPIHGVLEVPRDREAARASLDIPADAFLVCSFGFLGPTKLNERLLRAWQMSGLAHDRAAWLVFVGENEGGAYGGALIRAIRDGDTGDRVRITGFVDSEGFDRYLAAADVAVQLRTGSRGESSAAIVRALAVGLPTVLNAHGTSADYPASAVCRLDDEFEDATLAAELRRLRDDPELRGRLGIAARGYVASKHLLPEVASQYRDAIERFATDSASTRERRLVRAIAADPGTADTSSTDRRAVAATMAAHRPQLGPKQLLVDVSVVSRNDLRTGIERVVRGVLSQWLRDPPPGYRVEPIRDNGSGQFVYARDYTLHNLGLDRKLLADEPVETRQGDVYVGLDWYADGIPRVEQTLARWRARGVAIHFVVYDLLPILMPDAFPPSSRPMVEAWLQTITRVGDGVACISRTVADEFCAWLTSAAPPRKSPLAIGHFPLGSTLADTLPTTGMSTDVAESLAAMTRAPMFLMVGTVEPRKAHDDVLEAFEQLWADGVDVNLVIVGKQGWMVEMLAARLRSHPMSGARLFWLESASDEVLERLYAGASALIAASRGEGFGLPIVEAARHGTSVIARDLAVFREAAADHALYFSEEPEALAQAVRHWLELHRAGNAPDSGRITLNDWGRSVDVLAELVLGSSCYGRLPRDRASRTDECSMADARRSFAVSEASRP